MSNNARVVQGGEIGAAQYFQALAAGVTPCVDHNPILLKPEADVRSQVVVLGQVDRVLTEMPWRERAPYLWGIVRDAYDRVALVGRGSPRALPQVLDGLADLVDQYLDMDAVLHLTGCGPAP
jgi:adenosylcobyric acid synthase